MKRKVASAVMLTLLLVGVWTFAFEAQSVKAEPRTWIVDDDGPADFHEIQDALYAANPGDTIFVRNGIYHERPIIPNNDLTLIGESKNTTIIDGDGAGSIVNMDSRNNVKFSGFTVRNAGWGDWIGIAICMKDTKSCVVSDNIVLNSRYGIAPLSVSATLNNIIHGNIISGTELAIVNFYDELSVGNIVSGNSISNSSFAAIYFNLPYNTTVMGNTILNSNVGISFKVGGSINSVVDNNVSGSNYAAIYVSSADNNVVSRNTVSNSFYGIILNDGSNNNTVTGNLVSNNIFGIDSDTSNNSRIYHNNFIDNTYQVLISNSFNTTWDDDYLSGGNYWSDYTDTDLYSGPYQNETGSDGIWDHPYVIDGSNRDRYPFTPTTDIAVVSVVPSSTEVYVGQTVNVTVTVRNEGDFAKTFEVTCKGKPDGVEHTIGIQTVSSLSPKANATLTFTWTAADIAVHTIKAETPILTGETDTVDNTLTSPTTIKVKMLGDVNGDNIIDIFDLVAAALSFGCVLGDPDWKPQTDIIKDNIVDIFDMVTIAQNFGRTYP